MRAVPQDERAIVAPADGLVTLIQRVPPPREMAGPDGLGDQPMIRVSIFMSVFDVHINRTPVPGRVIKVAYVPGTFRPAYRPDSSRNEHSEIWIDAGNGVVVVTRQVVGVLARRVVCRVQTGETLTPGARIGLMKFGSRMDVFVPTTATLAVTQGDRVRAGVTVVARLTERHA